MSIFSSCSKLNDIYGIGNEYVNGSNSGSGVPGLNEVWIQGMAYVPSTITINSGTTITWTNKDGVTSEDGLFGSDTLKTNDSYSYLFPTAGTYTYYDNVHPAITGTVKVK